MSEEKKVVETPAVDLDALIAKAVEAGRQAERDKLAKEPPTSTPGLSVTKDETDKKAKVLAFLNEDKQLDPEFAVLRQELKSEVEEARRAKQEYLWQPP